MSRKLSLTFSGERKVVCKVVLALLAAFLSWFTTQKWLQYSLWMSSSPSQVIEDLEHVNEIAQVAKEIYEDIVTDVGNMEKRDINTFIKESDPIRNTD